MERRLGLRVLPLAMALAPLLPSTSLLIMHLALVVHLASAWHFEFKKKEIFKIFRRAETRDHNDSLDARTKNLLQQLCLPGNERLERGTSFSYMLYNLMGSVHVCYSSCSLADPPSHADPLVPSPPSPLQKPFPLPVCNVLFAMALRPPPPPAVDYLTTEKLQRPVYVTYRTYFKLLLTSRCLLQLPGS